MKAINSYIDRCLLDEYADKDLENGFSLDIDFLPEYEIENFLDQLMKNDTTIRDLVYYHMQKLINRRLSEYESENRYDLIKELREQAA